MAQAAGRATPKSGGKASSGTTTRSTNGSANGSTTRSTVKSAKAPSTTPVRAVSAPPAASSASGGAAMTSITAGLRGFADRFGLTRLLQPAAGRAGNGASGATGATKPKSSSFKFLLGMMIFIFSAEFLVYLLSFVDRSLFKGALETPIKGLTLPLLGTLSPFFILYILLTLGLWMALYRFNIIPKDPFGVKAQQAAARSGSKGAASTTSGVGRNRAARQAATTATKETASSRRTASGPNDAVYQRVKAAQRSRKRRDAKR